MAAKLHVSPIADLDVGDVFAWYEDHQAGLGDEFLVELDRCFHYICEHPLVHATVHKNFRRALVHRFPYAVFYKLENDIVEVYCVCHSSRKTQAWRKRLK